MSKKGFWVCAAVLFLGVNVFGFWGEPILLDELNDHENGYNATSPCLTDDELTIYFVRVSGYSQKFPNVRVYDIFEAKRDYVDEPFGIPEPIKELKIEGEGEFLTNPWVSSDNLRLYYSQTLYEYGEYQRFIRMAERESVDSQWYVSRTFYGIHFKGGTDSAPCLSEDELRIYWTWNSLDKSEFGVYTAERPNRRENFGNVRRLDEFDVFEDRYRVRVLDDELTVYVTNNEGDGQRVIYRGSRESIDEPFGNFEVVEVPEVNPSLPFLNDEETRMYMSTHEAAGIYMFEWAERPYDAAAGKIEEAIAMKAEMIEILDAAMETEIAALGDLADVLIRREVPEGVSYFDIFKARLKVIQSLIKEWKCRYDLQKSIYDLEMSLKELTPEEEPVFPWGWRSKESRKRGFGNKRRK